MIEFHVTALYDVSHDNWGVYDDAIRKVMDTYEGWHCGAGTGFSQRDICYVVGTEILANQLVSDLSAINPAITAYFDAVE